MAGQQPGAMINLCGLCKPRHEYSLHSSLNACFYNRIPGPCQNQRNPTRQVAVLIFLILRQLFPRDKAVVQLLGLVCYWGILPSVIELGLHSAFMLSFCQQLEGFPGEVERWLVATGRDHDISRHGQFGHMLLYSLPSLPRPWEMFPEAGKGAHQPHDFLFSHPGRESEKVDYQAYK